MNYKLSTAKLRLKLKNKAIGKFARLKNYFENSGVPRPYMNINR